MREKVSRVADTAREEGGRAADEVKDQGRRLCEETASKVRVEADNQTGRATDGRRSSSQDLRSMAEGEDHSAPAASWVRQGADRIDSFAERVDRRGFDGLMDDVGSFARRHPGMLLAISFGTGLVASRVIRNMSGDTTSHPQPSRPVSR